MTRFLFSLPLLFFFALCQAQNDSAYVSTTVETNIYSTSYKDSHDKLIAFLEKNHIKVQSQNENKSSIHLKFQVNEEIYLSYNALVPELGYVSSNEANTVNNSQTVSEIKLELKYLEEQRQSYKEVLGKVELNSEKYFSIWEEMKRIEEKIFNQEKELLPYQRKENFYTINLDMQDEVTRPENNRVSFVNMPGAEYSMLRIESPKYGISASTYNGYFLKYLFTKGKSYATIGAYKTTEKNTGDSTFNELFMFGFGQDFYSRHFGRGDNRFLNLYSGYTLGDIIATSETRKSNILYISPAIGLELIKTRFILLDTKVNYFIPLSYNKNLRGWSFNFAFNFVF